MKSKVGDDEEEWSTAMMKEWKASVTAHSFESVAPCVGIPYFRGSCAQLTVLLHPVFSVAFDLEKTLSVSFKTCEMVSA